MQDALVKSCSPTFPHTYTYTLHTVCPHTLTHTHTVSTLEYKHTSPTHTLPSHFNLFTTTGLALGAQDQWEPRWYTGMYVNILPQCVLDMSLGPWVVWVMSEKRGGIEHTPLGKYWKMYTAFTLYTLNTTRCALYTAHIMWCYSEYITHITHTLHLLHMCSHTLYDTTYLV